LVPFKEKGQQKLRVALFMKILGATGYHKIGGRREKPEGPDSN